MTVLKMERPDEPASANLPVSEDSLAVAFAREYELRAKYCHLSGYWFLWDGARWKKNKRKLALQWIRRMVRAYASGEAPKAAKDLGRSAVMHAIERLAQGDELIACTGDEFDTNDWLLGTPGGTVDLVTGELMPPDPKQMISRCTAVAPREGVPHRWLAFLREVTGGDGQLIAYLQHMFGYALTGVTSEQCLFFLYGGGGNGKSTLMNVLCGILGDYAVTAPMEAFTVSARDRHETEVAMMAGARVVKASETEEGRSWAESRIKSITGSEEISARFLHRDYFSFTPKFKLIISGNHKPVLRNVDKAIGRRFRMLPFLFTPKEEDGQLGIALRQEWPEILQWAIEGCLDWQESGRFPPCEAVVQMTSEYLHDQDMLAQFIEQCCVVSNPDVYADPDNPRTIRTASRLLFRGYSLWCETRNEKPGSERRFCFELEKKGFHRVREVSGRKWLGIALNDLVSSKVGAMVDGL